MREYCAEISRQGWMNFQCPWGPGKVTVRADEVAQALGWKSVSSVYHEAEREGTWLEVERRVGMSRAEMRFTARSVMLMMAREALEGGMIQLRKGRVQPPLFLERAKSLLTHLTRSQLDEMAAEIARLKGTRK